MAAVTDRQGTYWDGPAQADIAAFNQSWPRSRQDIDKYSQKAWIWVEKRDRWENNQKDPINSPVDYSHLDPDGEEIKTIFPADEIIKQSAAEKRMLKEQSDCVNWRMRLINASWIRNAQLTSSSTRLRGSSPERSTKQSFIPTPMYRVKRSRVNGTEFLCMPLEKPKNIDRTLKRLAFRAINLAKNGAENGSKKFQRPAWTP